MNRLERDERAAVVRALVEGNGIRSTVRMTGVAKNTVAKLLVDIGIACYDYQRAALVGLECRRLQVDEIWSFVAMKQKNVPTERKDEEGVGDVWTWVAIDAETKLVPSWYVGPRDAGAAHEFMTDVASRLTNRVQLTSDGHYTYLEAVENAFGFDIDYAQLVKHYKAEVPGGEVRYSPAKCTGATPRPRIGAPEMRQISTSYVERQNLTMRMGMRRFTRLTNAVSKKFENRCAAIALHFMNYNFARIHGTLRVAPAMAAGVSDHAWEVEEIVGLLERAEGPVAAAGSN
jgi:IS1 family transposase